MTIKKTETVRGRKQTLSIKSSKDTLRTLSAGDLSAAAGATGWGGWSFTRPR